MKEHCEHKNHDPLPFMEMLWWQQLMMLIALGCAAIACILSIHHMYKHLSHYTKPNEQKHIVRILLMVPIFAVDSFCSLWFNSLSLFFDVARDCYEALVLWEFFALLMEYLDGEENVVTILRGKPPIRHPPPLCCFPPFVPSTKRFLYRCKQFILQYVVVMPLCTLATFIMEVVGVYCNGEFTFSRGYLYITIILNVSVTLSLYFLVLFFITVEEELKPHKPLPKFIAIKAILFFSFWQSVVLSGLAAVGIIKPMDDWNTTDIGASLDNFIICIEMMIIALCHRFIFPWELYSLVPVEGEITGDGEQPAMTKKHSGSIKSSTSKFFKDVANPADVFKQTAGAFKRGTRLRGATILENFLQSTTEERAEMVVHEGWMHKISGAILLRWKKYYFFLLREPCGICWFPSYPFKDKNPTIGLVSSGAESDSSETEDTDGRSGTGGTGGAGGVDGTGDTGGIDAPYTLEEAEEPDELALRLDREKDAVLGSGGALSDEGGDYVQVDLSGQAAAPEKKKKKRRWFQRKKKAKRWLFMQDILSVRCVASEEVKDESVVESKKKDHKSQLYHREGYILEVDTREMNFLLRFDSDVDREKWRQSIESLMEQHRHTEEPTISLPQEEAAEEEEEVGADGMIAVPLEDTAGDRANAQYSSEFVGGGQEAVPGQGQGQDQSEAAVEFTWEEPPLDEAAERRGGGPFYAPSPGHHSGGSSFFMPSPSELGYAPATPLSSATPSRNSAGAVTPFTEEEI